MRRPPNEPSSGPRRSRGWSSGSAAGAMNFDPVGRVLVLQLVTLSEPQDDQANDAQARRDQPDREHDPAG
jgi:hypothetical protein